MSEATSGNADQASDDLIGQDLTIARSQRKNCPNLSCPLRRAHNSHVHLTRRLTTTNQRTVVELTRTSRGIGSRARRGVSLPRRFPPPHRPSSRTLPAIA